MLTLALALALALALSRNADGSGGDILLWKRKAQDYLTLTPNLTLARARAQA